MFALRFDPPEMPVAFGKSNEPRENISTYLDRKDADERCETMIAYGMTNCRVVRVRVTEIEDGESKK